LRWRRLLAAADAHPLAVPDSQTDAAGPAHRRSIRSKMPSDFGDFNGKFSAEVSKTEPSAPADLLCN
jgi:hypothetical protein